MHTVTLGIRSWVKQVRDAKVRSVEMGSCTPDKLRDSNVVSAVMAPIWRSDMPTLFARFRDLSCCSCAIACQMPLKCAGGGRYLYSHSQ